MKINMRIFLLLFVCGVLCVPTLNANEKKAPRSVGFFEAKDQGLIEVKLNSKNSLDGQMIVKNLTDEHLDVRKPFAFGAVPVLAQGGFFDEIGMGSGGGGEMGSGRSGRGGRSGSSSSSSGGNQSSGGGFGSGSSGGSRSGGGGGGGGGGWSIAPNRTVREQVKTVCLEHGKKEPNLRVKYDVRRIDEIAASPEVALLCAQVGTGAIEQGAGQAAVWHANCDMSWDELANKTTAPQHGNPFVKPYFSRDQIATAKNAMQRAEQYVKENKITLKKKVTTSESEAFSSEEERESSGTSRFLSSFSADQLDSATSDIAESGNKEN